MSRKGPEIWKWIPGYRGLYKVSDQGRVKSVERKCVGSHRKCLRKVKERILKQSHSNGGKYHFVGLRKDDICKRINIHILVLETFVGPCPPGKESRHLNDDGTNNRLSNLCWGTPRQNHRDKVRNGWIPHRVPKKLNEEQVKEIRKMYRLGFTQKYIGRKFGVTAQFVGQLISRKWWNHI